MKKIEVKKHHIYNTALIRYIFENNNKVKNYTSYDYLSSESNKLKIYSRKK